MPIFLTRREAAERLRLTTRQVDRLAKDGVLTKQKLSSHRSGFDRSGLEAHLAKLGGPARAPITDGGLEYGTRGQILIVKLEDPADGVAAALERVLCDNGLVGCILHGRGDTIAIARADSLPYCEADMRKAQRMATAAVGV